MSAYWTISRSPFIELPLLVSVIELPVPPVEPVVVISARGNEDGERAGSAGASHHA